MNSRLAAGTPIHARTLSAASRGFSPATSRIDRPVRYAQAESAGRSDGPSSRVERTSSSRETSTSPPPTLIHLVAPSTSTLDIVASSSDVASCVRQDAQLLGPDEVQRVNVLTVIASESYETFVRDLQRDIKETLRERPQKVEIDFFSGKTLSVDGEEVSFSAADSKTIYKYLIKNDFLDEADRPSDDFRAMLGEGKFQGNAMHELPEGLNDEAHAKAIETLLRGVYDLHALDGMVQQAQEKVTENAIVRENFGRSEFKELWDRISRKHSYTVSFDDGELERKAVARINKDLAVSRLQYTMTAGAQRHEGRREELASGRSFVAERSETHDVDEAASPVEVTYDLVGEVASAAQITRASAARILSAISPQVFSLYRVNPEEFIKRAGGLILSEKAAMVVEHVEYHETGRSYDTAIFTSRMPDNASKAYEASKNVQRFVFPDSQGERKFAEDLDAADEVVVYAKLPRAFQIPTPVGNYAPDWAIAFKRGSVRHVFFVAETKGTMYTMEISGVEKAKIRCAEQLFDEASTSDVRYHQVADYDDLLQWVGRLE